MAKNNWTSRSLVILLIVVLVTSCNAVGKEGSPSQASELTITGGLSTGTFIPSPEPPTSTFTSPPPTATLAPTDTPTPLPTSDLSVTLTAMPTSLPSLTPTGTPTATMSFTATPGVWMPGVVENSARIYFIEKNTGGPICGDSLVPVATSIARTDDIEKDVEAVLDLLLSYKSKYVGNLYNPVYNTNMKVSDVLFDYGLITVNFVGTITRTKDHCERARLKAVIWTTIKQFKDIVATNINLNHAPFGDMLSNE